MQCFKQILFYSKRSILCPEFKALLTMPLQSKIDAPMELVNRLKIWLADSGWARSQPCSGIGLLVFRSPQQVGKKSESMEANIGKKDVKWLAGVAFSGGILAPIVLMYTYGYQAKGKLRLYMLH